MKVDDSLTLDVLFFGSFMPYHEALSFHLLECSCTTDPLTLDNFTHLARRTNVVTVMFI